MCASPAIGWACRCRMSFPSFTWSGMAGPPGASQVMNGNTQGTAPIRLVSAATSAFESTAVRLELARDRSTGRGQ